MRLIMADDDEVNASHNSPPSHESGDATNTIAQGEHGPDVQDDAEYLGHQSILLLQHMSGMIQNAMAQMEQRMDAKFASKSEEIPQRPTVVDIGSNRVTDESTRKERSDRVSFKTFKTCGATEFSGAIDPIEAYDWLSTMEKVFDISHCWDTDRVTYAAAMFTGRALEWWKNTSMFMGAEQRKAMTWEIFTEMFLQQYCPPDLQRKYTREFLELKQGDMTVETYETEFHRKAKFATQYLSNEKERIAHFVEGLRDEIQEFVEIREISNLAKAVEYARQREQTLCRRSSVMPPPKRQFRDSHFSIPSFFQSLRYPTLSRARNQTASNSHSISQCVGSRSCFRCGKMHTGRCNGPRRPSKSLQHRPNSSKASLTCFSCGGPGHVMTSCLKRTGGCFECGALGHIKKFCPRFQDGMSQSLPVQSIAGSSQTMKMNDIQQAKARAFQITADEAREAPDVVTGRK